MIILTSPQFEKLFDITYLIYSKNNLGLFITSINDNEYIDSMFKSIVNDSLTITAFDITTNKENANCTIQ